MTAEQNRLLIQRPMRPHLPGSATSSGERNIFRVRKGQLPDATEAADNPKPDAATRPGRVTSAGPGEN